LGVPWAGYSPGAQTIVFATAPVFRAVIGSITMPSHLILSAARNFAAHLWHMRHPNVVVGERWQEDGTMRLRILSEQEIDDLYGRPHFTQQERDEYFALSVQEKPRLNNSTRTNPNYFLCCNWVISKPVLRFSSSA
jgi:hypothetical protein